MPPLYRLTDQIGNEKLKIEDTEVELSISNFQLSIKDLIARLAERIFNGEKITYDTELLQTTVKPFLKGIAKGYGKSLADVDYNTPDFKTLQKLTENVFQFSASKDFNLLRDMTNALKDSDGKMRSFDDFRQEVDRMNAKYNINWLRTEYNQAVASSQCAARWTDYGKHADKNPFLQYQAVMDANTRAEHAALHGVIKRYDDDFWDKYYPPNGWGCRCEVIQLPGKNHKETPDADLKHCKVDDMWKVNVGKKGVVFPKGHPYFMQRCRKCNGTPQNLAIHPQCAACQAATKECKKLIEGNLEIVDKNGKLLDKKVLDTSPAKGFNFKQLGDVVNNKMKELKCGSEVSQKIVVRENNVRLFIENGVMTFAAHFNKKKDNSFVVELFSIRVDEQWQKKGIAKSIITNMVEQSKNIGINKIKFTAKKDGSYTWAKMGFKAKNRKSIQGIKDERVKEMVKDYYSKHDENTPFPMQDIAEQEWGEKVLKEMLWLSEVEFVY